MKSLAQELLDQHIQSNENKLEFMIDEKNQKNVMEMYRDYSKMGLNPNVEERNGVFFLVADFSSKMKSNVIDLKVRKVKEATVIDFEQFKLKKSAAN